jgi:hypothetical protein
LKHYQSCCRNKVAVEVLAAAMVEAVVDMVVVVVAVALVRVAEAAVATVVVVVVVVLDLVVVEDKSTHTY